MTNDRCLAGSSPQSLANPEAPSGGKDESDDQSRARLRDYWRHLCIYVYRRPGRDKYARVAFIRAVGFRQTTSLEAFAPGECAHPRSLWKIADALRGQSGTGRRGGRVSISRRWLFAFLDPI